RRRQRVASLVTEPLSNASFDRRVHQAALHGRRPGAGRAMRLPLRGAPCTEACSGEVVPKAGCVMCTLSSTHPRKPLYRTSPVSKLNSQRTVLPRKALSPCRNVIHDGAALNPLEVKGIGGHPFSAGKPGHGSAAGFSTPRSVT